MKLIEIMKFEEWTKENVEDIRHKGIGPGLIDTTALAYYNAKYANYLCDKMREIVNSMGDKE